MPTASVRAGLFKRDNYGLTFRLVTRVGIYQRLLAPYCQAKIPVVATTTTARMSEIRILRFRHKVDLTGLYCVIH